MFLMHHLLRLCLPTEGGQEKRITSDSQDHWVAPEVSWRSYYSTGIPEHPQANSQRIQEVQEKEQESQQQGAVFLPERSNASPNHPSRLTTCWQRLPWISKLPTCSWRSQLSPIICHVPTDKKPAYFTETCSQCTFLVSCQLVIMSFQNE